MDMLRHIHRLTSDQRNAFVAHFLDWSLDAFDTQVLALLITPGPVNDWRVSLEQVL